MARWGPPTLFTIPVLRYITTYGTSHERLAMVSVVQREWAAMNPRATFKTPITVGDVLNSWMIAGPFRLLQRCLVTDGGGALIPVSAARIASFRTARLRRNHRPPFSHPEMAGSAAPRLPRGRDAGTFIMGQTIVVEGGTTIAP